jgi:outer membrane lipoprotein-sorting protein
MFRILIFFFILNFYSLAQATIKERIINRLKQTETLSFNFKQTIDENSETGNCIIKYSKKIYCEYNNVNKKIIVSNGKSLVIKNRKNGTSFIYPIKKTSLGLLLDKDYLIKKISILEPRDANKYLNFKIIENDNEINIFFNKKTLNLIGWQTEDIYQNLTITFIYSIKINQKINEKIFILPSLD